MFREIDLECRDSDLNESTNLWWRFSDLIDRTANVAPRGLGISRLLGDNQDFNIESKQNQEIFLRGNSIWENHEEKGENSLFSRSYNDFYRVAL